MVFSNYRKSKNLFLIIHGHFYQPPREDAWTGEILRQPSAAPFHDWNERIYQECYKPNTEAVIVDSEDNVIRKVNNFEYLSFNFGPSLLQWIQKKHPKTYDKIIEADKRSIFRHNGHGNAIAQVYNHMIMPLANEKDKITQVKWGVEDFIFHFGRKPEGIWLSETACDDATVEVLIEEGIKFIILDPSQAEKVRKLAGGKWEDVSNGSIDTRMPFRYFSSRHFGKSLNIFFYDGLLSKNIAFDDYVFSAERLMDRIKSINLDNSLKDELVSAAIDGETFGHHKHYTERTIAYMLSELAPGEGYHVTNFSEFNSFHLPDYEVRLKKGPNGEGTSWSCSHGVGRWKEDCGCNGGGEPGWDQKWRKPLRESLDWLRDEADKVFEEHGSEYLKDVWKARNDYIHVILNGSRSTIEKFFYFNARRFLTEHETELCLKLLSMEEYRMLMYTSCGWFFSDISGIETIQILQYASRVIELYKEITGINLEERFLEKLADASSNIPRYKNGRYIFETKINKPKAYSN